MAKNILIAGGTDGIGFSMVEIIVRSQEFDTIYVLGRNFKKIDSIKSGRIVPIKSDICDYQSCKASLELIDSLSVFVNTIGTYTKRTVADNTPEMVEDHFALNAVGNINLTNLILPKLEKNFSQIMVCLSTLISNPKKEYSLQCATKSAYQSYIECLQLEYEYIRIMTVYPSSLNTKVFEKGSDFRDCREYPEPYWVANIMKFMLDQDPRIHIPEVAILNRRKS